jgi:hypothetical protein
MTDCGVCIGGGDYDGSYEFYSDRVVRARKLHKCYECGRQISIGSQYQRYSGKWEGQMDSFTTCLDCMNIREGLSRDGRWPPFGQLWDEIHQVFGEVVSTACLAKIPTSAAKAYFLERWRKWKGIGDLTMEGHSQ